MAIHMVNGSSIYKLASLHLMLLRLSFIMLSPQQLHFEGYQLMFSLVVGKHNNVYGPDSDHM